MLQFLKDQLRTSSTVDEEILRKISSSKRLKLIEQIAHLSEMAPKLSRIDLKNVSLSAPELPAEFKSQLMECVSALIPWRKGPFRLFDLHLDSEWRSDLKWDRLGLAPEDVQGKRVADVGCGNGYYMFRLAHLGPEEVVGFDPTDRYLLQYLLIRSLIPEKLPLRYSPRRSDALRETPSHFQLTLCLGVLYHHPNPRELLQDLFVSLSPGGELYLETLFAPEESLNLHGDGPYARMWNVYLIPTLSEVESMLQEVGFREIQCTSNLVLSVEEQRRTLYAPGDSLQEFLSTTNSALTVEGYFRPHRAIFRARRP